MLRVIARMNAGGPAYHVSLLSGLLDPGRFETLLVTGDVGPGEASLADMADDLGVRRRHVRTLGPELRPLADLRALVSLVRIARTYRPDVVHTHTAKAGMLGRLAALGVRPRPVIVHTYHGHVLEGYFGRAKSGFYRGLERGLARVSDRLVGVSQATVDDLVRLRVAPPERFAVVPLGLRLERFLELAPEPRGPVREELGLEPGDVLLTFVGRLVPIKRVDRLLDAVAAARRAGAPVILAVVGDGEERAALEARAGRLPIADRVRFLGYRRDLADIVAATDIAVLTSDNEGTPVSLIEAGAGARPMIATRVGGVADVVARDTGVLVEPDDVAGFAEAIAALAGDPERRRALGSRAREHIGERYRVPRLLERIAGLYEELLDGSPVSSTPEAHASRTVSSRSSESTAQRNPPSSKA